MKKTNLAKTLALTVLFVLSGMGNLSAQIFIMSDEEFYETKRVENVNTPMLPGHNSTLDQYAPLGGGIAPIACLGLAYLLLTKRKQKHTSARLEHTICG